MQIYPRCISLKPTENLSIDEQLYPYLRCTGFTLYKLSKLAKYGIKIWWICDAETTKSLAGFKVQWQTE